MMQRLVRMVSGLVGALLLVAVAINFSNVFGRYLLDMPIFWAEEGMGFIQIAIVVIGAALVARDNAHLKMDAVEHFMPAALKRWVDVATAALTVVVALVIVWMASDVVMQMVQNDQRSMAMELPLAIPYSIFPLGFSLIALFALARLVRLLSRKK
ncbi:MAG TPA: TRAP transporter small permease [Burkholderiales bacterium]|jgi:C4-dicarboxylate transporter DctQ subunit|nr:TRAP transporter small permease [Burkholderiales bacterium]